MNRELAVYLRIQASVSAAFSFFIGGMAAALIYHKADFVWSGFSAAPCCRLCLSACALRPLYPL
jgi:hypothetical protein